MASDELYNVYSKKMGGIYRLMVLVTGRSATDHFISTMELKDQRVLVVGLGKSGVASALFLKAHGARVTVSDTKPAETELRQRDPALLDHGITGRDAAGMASAHFGGRT